MKIEFDIVNREFFRTLTFSLKFQKKAQVSIIYSTLQVYQWSYSQVRHIPPKMSDKFESQHSKSDYLVGRESGCLKIFFYISRGEYVKHFVIDAYL